MNDDNSRKRLGRGLAALIGEMDQTETAQQPRVKVDQTLPIELIAASPNNPRRTFAEEDLEELSASLREHGLIQPIVVRPSSVLPGTATHEIIAGERRWRAAQRAGLIEVPVIIRDVDDRVALELAIIENVQRADLNPMEEAMGYQQLIDEHAYTQNDLGRTIGKSRSHVANTLRLLKLPHSVQHMVSDGSLSAGHARTLVTADDPDSLAKRIVREGLSVREAERLANGSASPQAVNPGGSTAQNEKDADTLALEKTLSDALGFAVTIDHKGPGGAVKVQYKTLEQLDSICRRLQGQ